MKVTAKVIRSGSWWAIEVPEIPGLFSQAKRLDQVAAMVADAAGLLGHDEVEVSVMPRLSETDAALIADAIQGRAKLRAVEEQAGKASRAAVARLREDGLCVRDIAVLLGISPQRVSVLATT